MNTKLDRASLLPEIGYLRLAQIIGRPARNGRPAIPAIIPVSRSTWWAGVKLGRYPQPVRSLGPNITAWRVEDVRTWIEREWRKDSEPRLGEFALYNC